MKMAGGIAAMLLAVTSPSFADCRSIGQEAVAKRNALVVAKDEFKKDFVDSVGRNWTPAELDVSIAATIKVKAAEDAVIEVILRAQAENCFGKDAASWAAVIVEMKRHSAELGETIQDYRRMKEAIRRSGR